MWDLLTLFHVIVKVHLMKYEVGEGYCSLWLTQMSAGSHLHEPSLVYNQSGFCTVVTAVPSIFQMTPVPRE